MEVLVLLACLSSTLGMITALLAFILARASGKSVYVAVRAAGVTFIATTTLAVLLLNFVGVSSASHQKPPQPVAASFSASKGEEGSNGGRQSARLGLWVLIGNHRVCRGFCAETLAWSLLAVATRALRAERLTLLSEPEPRSMTARSSAEPGEDSTDAVANQKIADLQGKYGDGFYRLARSRGICHLEALNVVQTSLLSMRERLVSKGPVENDLAYLSTVVKCQITQFFRDQKNAKEKPFDNIRELIPAAVEQSADQRSIKIWSTGRQLMLCAANSAVQELSEPLREVYELAVIALIEPTDIARMLEKKPVTVRAYLSTARKQVKARANELLAVLSEPQQYCEEK